MRAARLLLLVPFALLIAACGGGEEPSTSGGSGSTPSSQTEVSNPTPETPAEQPAEVPSEDPAEEPAEEPAGEGGAEEGASLSAEAIAAADAKYKAVCATCHGVTGRGDSPAAANFPIKPRDYSDKAWQATVTDEYIAQAIVEGGAAVGKSPLMPASPDLKDKPEVVAALVAKIRGFANE